VINRITFAFYLTHGYFHTKVSIVGTDLDALGVFVFYTFFYKVELGAERFYFAHFIFAVELGEGENAKLNTARHAFSCSMR
jgi:hypothetical protein